MCGAPSSPQDLIADYRSNTHAHMRNILSDSSPKDSITDLYSHTGHVLFHQCFLLPELGVLGLGVGSLVQERGMIGSIGILYV